MLMDQSWIAGKHPLHHVLNVLWEFGFLLTLLSHFRPDAGSSEGTGGITGV